MCSSCTMKALESIIPCEWISSEIEIIRQRERGMRKREKYTLVVVAFTLFILAVLGLMLLFYYFRVLTISELLVHQSNVVYINVALRIILWIFVMTWFNRLALVCKVTASHDNVSLGKYQKMWMKKTGAPFMQIRSELEAVTNFRFSISATHSHSR